MTLQEAKTKSVVWYEWQHGRCKIMLFPVHHNPNLYAVPGVDAPMNKGVPTIPVNLDHDKWWVWTLWTKDRSASATFDEAVEAALSWAHSRAALQNGNLNGTTVYIVPAK